MPFKSKEQERYLQINEPEIYQDWVEKYGRFKGAESFSAEWTDTDKAHSWIEVPKPNGYIRPKSLWRKNKHWKCEYCHEIKHTDKVKPNRKGCDVGYVDWDTLWDAESFSAEGSNLYIKGYFPKAGKSKRYSVYEYFVGDGFRGETETKSIVDMRNEIPRIKWNLNWRDGDYSLEGTVRKVKSMYVFAPAYINGHFMYRDTDSGPIFRSKTQWDCVIEAIEYAYDYSIFKPRLKVEEQKKWWQLWKAESFSAESESLLNLIKSGGMSESELTMRQKRMINRDIPEGEPMLFCVGCGEMNEGNWESSTEACDSCFDGWMDNLDHSAESFSAEECVSCDTPDGYWRGLPLCASSGEELCISCCACNMCRSKWNMLEVGEQKAESFSADKTYKRKGVEVEVWLEDGWERVYLTYKGKVAVLSRESRDIGRDWDERMKKKIVYVWGETAYENLTQVLPEFKRQVDEGLWNYQSREAIPDWYYAESFNAQNEKRSKYMNEKRSKYMDYIYDMFYTPDSDAYKLREIRYPKLKGQEHQIASQVKNAFNKETRRPFDSVLHNNLKGLSMTRQPFYYHIPYKGKLFVFSYIVRGRGRLKQGYHTYYPPDSQFGEEQICGLETKHGDECYCYRKNYKSESFGAEGDYEPSFDSLEERIEWMEFAVNDKFLHQYEDDYSNVVLDIEEWNENNGNNSKLSNLVKQYKNKTGWMDAESFEVDLEKCPKCDSGNLGKEEMYYCYTCGNDDASEDGCSKCGSDTVGEEEMDYCYTCGGHGHWFNAESFSAEDDMIICEGCNMERYSDVDFTIDNAREDVLDDGDVLCDYCWASHDKYVENAESFAAEAIPIRHSRRLNGYYGIKGYEDASEDGFIYRIYRAPGTNDWFKATVYDDNAMKDNFRKPTSRRLNPSGEMVISNNPSSLLIGAFPKLEDAKRALVFRMIQDGNYHQMITDGNLKWLLKDYYAESFSADNYEELITTCPYCEGVKIDDHDKYELVECFKRYLEDSTPHPDKRVMMLKKKAESFGAESYDSALVHLKSLMPINRDSYLRNFHPSELTHSSTNQINLEPSQR